MDGMQPNTLMFGSLSLGAWSVPRDDLDSLIWREVHAVHWLGGKQQEQPKWLNILQTVCSVLTSLVTLVLVSSLGITKLHTHTTGVRRVKTQHSNRTTRSTTKVFILLGNRNKLHLVTKYNQRWHWGAKSQHSKLSLHLFKLIWHNANHWQGVTPFVGIEILREDVCQLHVCWTMLQSNIIF